MGIKEEIIECLKDGNKTAKELSEELEIDLDTIKTTITRMKKAEMLYIDGSRDRFSVYALNPKFQIESVIEMLEFYDNLFKSNIDYLLNNDNIINTVMANSEITEKITKVIESFHKKV